MEDPCGWVDAQMQDWWCTSASSIPAALLPTTGTAAPPPYQLIQVCVSTRFLFKRRDRS
eukprot:CAMPEP_0202380828 /NCGR_PEP_ID=MMETSP1127-20130417/31454_1 /ASSEMBLY_ACC=CAM_ASM_000462 /TAXON_ID=3047 /ORGANISM="Dunaliella tertiolecta, Strain CCMP1320" /LENGTH=58 /DNA_ID=CAMNT_0048979621 /DNA_START=274 /DNA_END=447 /DNA_ORIENTATION=-